MISDNLAIPLAKVATHSFLKMVDPSKLSIQRIFVAYWASFLLDPEVVHRGLRPVIVKEVQKMMACGTLDAGFHILVPFFDVIRYKHSLKENAADIPEQICITSDNVQVAVDGPVVSISAERREEKDVKEGERVLRSEYLIDDLQRSYFVLRSFAEAAGNARAKLH